jgi:hypothetical protein
MPRVDLRPARLDYRITRGDDFADVVTIKEGSPPVAVDVSGRTFTAQVRRSADGEVVAAMAIDMSQAASGEVGYAVSDAVTATMRGAYVWDFQQAVGGVVRTLMGGKFIVDPDVTRSS